MASTHWLIPEFDVHFPQPIDRLIFSPPSTLWIGLSGSRHTLIRWDLETLRAEAILFPVPDAGTRALVLSPTARHLVIERAGITLLCDAQTLKPIRDLGPLPAELDPSAVITFSDSGLLFAHPTHSSDSPDLIIWQIRDSSTGEIVRTELAPDNQPLAAHLNRTRLQVIHQDGSLLEIPVIPTTPVETIPATETIRLVHAQYATNGQSVLAAEYLSPHQAPEQILIPLGGTLDDSLSPVALSTRFPWHRAPGIWTGLFREDPDPPIRVRGNTAQLPNHSAITTPGEVTAITTGTNLIFHGDSLGNLTCHRILPLPIPSQATISTPPADSAPLRKLCEFLAHPENHPATTFTGAESSKLQRTFQTLDLTPLVAAINHHKLRTPPADALALYHSRLASDPAAAKPIEDAFETYDPATIVSAIRAAGPHGPAAAKALELALESTHPEYITACLETSTQLPPLLAKLAVSRIAWLENRRADALTGWSRPFPSIRESQLREDWNGWEHADYSIALEKLRLGIEEILSSLEVPEDSTPEQRQAIAERLTHTTTLATVGRKRLATAALNAALAFANFPEESETTFQLAELARNLGAPAAPCLRAEAIALTSHGEYKKAYDRWLLLITNYPIAAQQPGDYAEASYTAFENAEPLKAMQILTTGLHRFPNDAHFALRAGWIALLTGNSERAYRFLLTGDQIGYPDDKLENATALLAIAAQQTGSFEDAAAYYDDLIRLDPAWQIPETIETLPWPNELKDPLRQLVP
ncbi:MAG: tetratricopeptide repeat protein [Verrucomicrobiota bacterium JB025]|nr:WD40 repeat domain-containing protein [Verrucomicrobiota bacterium JB025]